MTYKIMKENFHGRDFVVGDIHGHFHDLHYKLKSLGFDETKDRLFSVGDLVDRGPDHHLLLSWLDEPWFFPVRGNHEDMLIDATNNPTNRDLFEFHFFNGGHWFYAERWDSMRGIVAQCLDALPYMLEIPYKGRTFGVVHAEPPFNDWDKAKSSLDLNTGSQYNRAVAQATWARTRISMKSEAIVSGIDHVYVGHSSRKKPITLGNVSFIDTGAGFSKGYLTVIELGSDVPLITQEIEDE